MIPYEKKNQAFVATGGATDVKSVIANFESLSVRQNRTTFSRQDVGGDKQMHILDEKKKLENIDSRSTEACVDRKEEAKREESEPLILYDGVIDDQLDEKNLPAVEPHYPSKEVLKNNLQGLHGGAGNNATSFSSTKSTTKKKVMLVYYTGGVSYIEIAALRFLSRKPDFPYHILIATTCIVNGSRLIEQIAPKQRNSLKMIAAQ